MIQISNVNLLEKVMTKPSMIYETKMTISVFHTFKTKQGQVLCCSTPLAKNISVISWRSVLLVEETGVPTENQPSTCKSQNVVSSTPRHGSNLDSQLQWWQVLIAQVVVNPTTMRSRPRRFLEKHMVIAIHQNIYISSLLSCQLQEEDN